MSTIDVGRWRCGCGFFLDLTDQPDSNVIECRCRRCERRYRVQVVVMELVPVAVQTAEVA